MPIRSIHHLMLLEVDVMRSITQPALMWADYVYGISKQSAKCLGVFKTVQETLYSVPLRAILDSSCAPRAIAAAR